MGEDWSNISAAAADEIDIAALETAVREWRTEREKNMHYRNGREAKNGDPIVQIDSYGKLTNYGILFNGQPGNDYCNGSIASAAPQLTGACLCDCLHVDDVNALLKEKGWDKRPAGK